MKVLITFDDRVRQDSTAIYFYHAFCKIADVVRAYNEELPSIDGSNFDLCIKIDDGLLSHRFPKKFSEVTKTAYYCIDSHLDLKNRMELAEEGNIEYIFTAQKPASQQKWHTDKVKWVPLGCDPNFHMVKGKRTKLYDVGFVGNVNPHWQMCRLERLDKLFKAFPNYYFGAVFFKDMAEKFSECKIVFNSSVLDDINMRHFESMASGSMLLTNKLNWQGMFTPDKHFVEYDGDEDMIRKAKYYIDHEVERERIANHGQMEVLSKHKYIDRVEEIIKTCFTRK